MTKKPKLGKLTLAIGRYPEKHELDTAAVFIRQGIDVFFLAESRTEGQHSADIEMNGVVWEIKNPIGSGKRTIEKQFHRASSQSKNVIIDGRRSGFSPELLRKMVEKQWESRHLLKRLILIQKDGKMLDFRR